jgi:hypothetical protein
MEGSAAGIKIKYSLILHYKEAYLIYGPCFRHAFEAVLGAEPDCRGLFYYRLTVWY